jgi:hypothetical protein
VKLSIKKIRTESLFTICFSIVALLPATAVSQGKAPIPDSKTMETYLRDDQLGKYIKMQAEKAKEMEETTTKKAIEDAKKTLRSTNNFTSNAEVYHPDKWDRGVDKITKKFNETADFIEMLMAYGECGSPMPVGVCLECALFPRIQALMSYYMPVQKIEISEVPGRTGYYEKTKLKRYMSEYGDWTKAKYGEAINKSGSNLPIEAVLKQQYEKTAQQSRKNSLGDPTKDWVLGEDKTGWFKKTKPDTALIDEAKNNNFNDAFWRVGKLPSASWAFPHIFNAEFDNEGTKTLFKDIWGHDGALEAERKTNCVNQCKTDAANERRSVPSWFAEGPESVQVFFNSIMSYNHRAPKSQEAKITKISIDKTAKGPRKHNYYDKMKNTKTPEDIWEQLTNGENTTPASKNRNREALEDNFGICGIYTHEGQKHDKCLRGQHGAKGPLTAQVGTLYHPRAAMVAAWRGLFWVTAIEDDAPVGTYKTSLDDDCDPKIPRKKYHPFYNENVNGKGSRFTGKPRARLQILTNHSPKRYRHLRGCRPFLSQKTFIPDWSGPEFGDANKDISDEHGNHTILVQWQHFRNCRTNFFRIFPFTGKNIWY